LYYFLKDFMKKRILMCGESSHITSGFGNYTKNILQRLHDTGKYEIAELSCYRDSSVSKTEPWTVYPAAVPTNHPLYKDYIGNDANQFGQLVFDWVLLDFKPHIVFDIRDFWNFTYQETSVLRPFYNWIIGPTYDSSPQKLETLNLFGNADLVCFHTEWAKQDLLNKFHYPHQNLGPIVNDAVDHNVYKPIGYSKRFHKIKYDIPPDSFVIGSVMRNQKRKLIPDILEVFSKLRHNNLDKNILLYLHTSYPDALMWDLPSLLLEYKIADKVLLTHICKNCHKIFPSVFQGVRSVCRHCNQNSAFIASLRNSVSEDQLCDIYNLFDVYVQYAICEGFGIPPVEAAACKNPIISINSEAMGEVGKNINAELVDVCRVFREQETNAKRSYPNNDHLYSILERYMNMPINELNKIGDGCRKKCLQNYHWDKTAKTFETIFDSVDVSSKIPWDAPQRQINMSYSISGVSDHRTCIYDIIDNIIQEPYLKNTYFIEELIRSANDGFVQNGTKQFVFNIENYIKILETYAKNKVSIETVRVTGSSSLPDAFKDIIGYSK